MKLVCFDFIILRHLNLVLKQVFKMKLIVKSLLIPTYRNFILIILITLFKIASFRVLNFFKRALARIDVFFRNKLTRLYLEIRKYSWLLTSNVLFQKLRLYSYLLKIIHLNVICKLYSGIWVKLVYLLVLKLIKQVQIWVL